jgi:hypothetical protein
MRPGVQGRDDRQVRVCGSAWIADTVRHFSAFAASVPSTSQLVAAERPPQLEVGMLSSFHLQRLGLPLMSHLQKRLAVRTRSSNKFSHCQAIPSTVVVLLSQVIGITQPHSLNKKPWTPLRRR